MKDSITLNIIAKIKTDFPTKFGIPRQSGIIPELKGKIVFEPEYRNPEALRGLEGFSHLWLLWKFSEAVSEAWSPTVRPPRLGGNRRMGVFATRSPFRPNPIGLSSVKIEDIIHGTPEGTVIVVSGADLLDGTPIYDIKPYIAYTDSHPDAVGGFSQAVMENSLQVVFEGGAEQGLPQEILLPLRKILENDPRPGYQRDSERIYSFEFSGYRIKFKADDLNLTVISAEKM
ncbi:MAG: tRNA (N6-threonylcarbamoyladenosine(37)-N6)-methyltransferase TrmO [Clostridia bacterium]|nr:tRNA (N6-threonylcarbamoyladenosine(37)-N6)-methyltransferase TrmO [Clostridia bacterium]